MSSAARRLGSTRLRAGAVSILILACDLMTSLSLVASLAIVGFGVYFSLGRMSPDRQLLVLWKHHFQGKAAPYDEAPPFSSVPYMRLEIPKIGLATFVLQGGAEETLRRAPTHIPFTAMPGQTGNVVISGHRQTYTAPFRRLGELSRGDHIRVTTPIGRFEYEVVFVSLVTTSRLRYILPTRARTLTLVTCSSLYIPSRRLVVVARLLGASRKGAPKDHTGGPLR